MPFRKKQSKSSRRKPRPRHTEDRQPVSSTSDQELVESTSDQEPVPSTSYQEPVPSTSYHEPVPSTSYHEPVPSTSYHEPVPSTSYHEPVPSTSYQHPVQSTSYRYPEYHQNEPSSSSALSTSSIISDLSSISGRSTLSALSVLTSLSAYTSLYAEATRTSVDWKLLEQKLPIRVEHLMNVPSEAQIKSKNRYQEFDLRQHLVRAVLSYGMNTPWIMKRKKVLTMYNYRLKDRQKTKDERATFYCRLIWLHLFENNFQTQIVLMTPSRKLANYLFDIFKDILYNSNTITVRLCTGEIPLVDTLEHFDTCCIAIGTPDRIFDLISCRVLWLSNLKIYLYDEDENKISSSFKHKIDMCLNTVSSDVRPFK